ncbi:MAG: response regulator [Bacteroidia bacterium]
MKKVLLVEDDPDIVDLLEIHLTDLDCQLTKAYDGIKGFQTAFQDTYDLIILDLMLPGMDGMEICRQIRAEKVRYAYSNVD